MTVTSRFTELLDDPWTVSADRFPSRATPDGKLRFALNYGVLAPSLLNTQPWRFRVRGGKLSLFADLSRRLPVTDPQDRELIIGCGAALLNLRVALQSFGGVAQVFILPNDSDHTFLASLQLTGVAAPSESERLLRDAIPHRHTYRGDFDDRPLSPSLFNDLASAALKEGARILFLRDAAQKKEAADLIAEAEEIQLNDPLFRSELSNWITKRISSAVSPPSEALFRLAGHLPELPAQPELFIPTAANMNRTFNADAAREQRRARALSAPGLALIVTDNDAAADWMAAGQALQRVLLTATIAGVAASFLSAPLEVATTRSRIKAVFGELGYPQVLLRLGYGAARAPIPRRRPAELLD